MLLRLIPLETFFCTRFPVHCSFWRSTGRAHMKHPVWKNLKFPWIEGEQRRNGKEEQEGRGEFFSLCKIHHLSCLQSFRRWSVMQVGLRTFSSSQKFIKPPQVFSGKVTRHWSWVFRGAKLNFLLPKGAYKQAGREEDMSHFSDMEEKWVSCPISLGQKIGGIFCQGVATVWKAMSQSHIITW